MLRDQIIGTMDLTHIYIYISIYSVV